MSMTPDFTDPIIAWRGWQVAETGEGMMLRSLTRDDVVWPAEGLEATCAIEPRVTWKAEAYGSVINGPSLVITLSGRQEDLVDYMETGFVAWADKAGKFRLRPIEEKKVDPPPHKAHQCGIYATTSDQLSIINGYGPDVVGAVELTGKVIPATHGFRAQKARVVSILRVNPEPDTLVSYSWEKGTGLDMAGLKAIAAYYGVELVDELPPTTDPKEVLKDGDWEGR